MKLVLTALLAYSLSACARSVLPAYDAADAIVDVRSDATVDHVDARRTDVRVPTPCGDAGFCGPNEICALGRCAGCCDVAPSCVPIPPGCTGELACGCFATSPCGGCTTCLSVDNAGVHCGNCSCACAAPWTPIETPTGPRPISELRVGDLVYSMDHDVLTIVPIARTVRTPVTNHAVARMVLTNGIVLEITGRHPTADGRTLNALRPGDRLGEAQVVSVETVRYEEPFTFDILPASESGAYFAAGALIGSTLR